MNGSKIIFSRLSNGATAAITSNRITPRQQFITYDNRQPYVVFYRNQTTPNATKTTTSVIDEQVFIIECYASTYDLANNLAEAVRTDLDRAPATVYSGVTLNGSSFLNQTEPVWDDKSELFDCEVEVRLRVSRFGTISTS